MILGLFLLDLFNVLYLSLNRFGKRIKLLIFTKMTQNIKAAYIYIYGNIWAITGEAIFWGQLAGRQLSAGQRCGRQLSGVQLSGRQLTGVQRSGGELSGVQLQ